MQLERSRAVLRTRTPLEAADLGILLLRRLRGPMLRATLIYVLPAQIAALWACSWLDPSVAWGFSLLALWWLKPLYDRPLGLVLGRGLFGEVPRGRAFARALWTQGRRKLLADLTYRRFDPARSLVAPITLLEGVSGAVARRRRRTLVMANTTPVTTILLACLAIEVGCAVGILIGGVMLMPEELPFILTDLFSSDIGEFRSQLALVGYAIAIAVCEPLYVASGFGLYIDQRTTLEGWDIQLAFRTMARRLAQTTTSIVALCAALYGATAHAQGSDSIGESILDGGAAVDGASAADLDDTDEATVVEDGALYSMGAAAPERRLPAPIAAEDGKAEAAMVRVLARPELERTHVEEHWELRTQDVGGGHTPLPGWISTLAKYIAESAEIVMWLLAGLVLAVLLYLLVENVRHAQQSTVVVHAPTREREIEIRFDKLPGRPLAPSQVVPRARELLAAGDTTAALSVLYVGTLGALVLLDALDVPAQATEGECLRRVNAAPIAAVRRELFADLTLGWQLSAYAHRVPEPDHVHALCERFAGCFGVPA